MSTSTMEALQPAPFLTFAIDDETYAVDVTRVREVLELMDITQIPRTPEHMRGVINVRGSVVPVFDLRLKFGLPEKQATVDTCIVVVEIKAAEETIVLGCLVDSVEEVIELGSAQIEPPPRLGAGIDTHYIKGMGKKDESFIILMDLDRLLTGDELEVAMDAKAELTSGSDDENRDAAEGGD